MLRKPTYGIFSLTQDTFIYFKEDCVLDIVIHFWQEAKSTYLPVQVQFYQWQGVQSLLRIMDVFARFKEKDHKDHYGNEIPSLMNTGMHIRRRYRSLHSLYRLLNKTLNLETAHALMSF